MIDPITWGAIALGAGLISSFVGNKANNKAAQRAQDRQNAYNHPAKQMERLAEAKLNPNLAYGMATTGNQMQPVKQKHDIDPNMTLNAISQYQQLQLSQAQTNNLKANTAVSLQEVLNKKASIELAQSQNALNNLKYIENSRLLQHNVDARKLGNDLLSKQLRQANATYDNTIQNTKLSQTQSQLNIEKTHDQQYQNQLNKTGLGKNSNPALQLLASFLAQNNVEAGNIFSLKNLNPFKN